MRIRTLLGEPMLHFLPIGIALFAAYRWMARGAADLFGQFARIAALLVEGVAVLVVALRLVRRVRPSARWAAAPGATHRARKASPRKIRPQAMELTPDSWRDSSRTAESHSKHTVGARARRVSALRLERPSRRKTGDFRRTALAERGSILLLAQRFVSKSPTSQPDRST